MQSQKRGTKDRRALGFLLHQASVFETVTSHFDLCIDLLIIDQRLCKSAECLLSHSLSQTMSYKPVSSILCVTLKRKVDVTCKQGFNVYPQVTRFSKYDNYKA